MNSKFKLTEIQKDILYALVVLGRDNIIENYYSLEIGLRDDKGFSKRTEDI